MRLPLPACSLAIGLSVLFAMVRHRYPSAGEESRVREAVEWIEALAAEHESILAVTHGSFRRVLAQRLEAGGWIAEGRSRRFGHWAAWTFSRPVSTPARTILR